MLNQTATALAEAASQRGADGAVRLENAAGEALMTGEARVDVKEVP